MAAHQLRKDTAAGQQHSVHAVTVLTSSAVFTGPRELVCLGASPETLMSFRGCARARAGARRDPRLVLLAFERRSCLWLPETGCV